MIDFGYLSKGLCGLARAHRANGMAGHLGAAVVAGYFFGETHPSLPGEVYQGVEKQLDRIIEGDEAIWFDQGKSGLTVKEMFDPFPEERADETQIEEIAKTLAGNIGQLRQSGHNVIFTSIALRGLRDHPEFATPSIVSGITKLIARFDEAVPGRGYWGKQQGWVIGDHLQSKPAPEWPPYESLQAMAERVIELLISMGEQNRRGFGGMVHLVNHAAAITELDAYGFGELAIAGLPAHHRHAELWKSLPDLSKELGPGRPSLRDPLTAAYWNLSIPLQASAQLTHRIKTMYGFFTLLRFIEDESKRRQAEEHYLYLMS